MSFLSENKKVIIPVGVVVAVLAIGTGILSAQVSSDKIAKNVDVYKRQVYNIVFILI